MEFMGTSRPWRARTAPSSQRAARGRRGGVPKPTTTTRRLWRELAGGRPVLLQRHRPRSRRHARPERRLGPTAHGRGAAHPGRRTGVVACASPAATTCATRWPPPPARWPPACRSPRRRGPGRLRAGQGPFARAAVSAGRAHHPGRRQLQRQPRLGGGRHPRAGRAAGRACWCWATWARSATRAWPSTSRCCARAGQWHRRRHCAVRRWMRQACRPCAPPAAGARHWADMDAAGGHLAVARAVAPGAQRAGQGLALHEDGARGAGPAAAGRDRTTRTTERSFACCLVWRNGCKAWDPSSAFSCACSSTSPSVR